MKFPQLRVSTKIMLKRRTYKIIFLLFIINLIIDFIYLIHRLTLPQNLSFEPTTEIIAATEVADSKHVQLLLDDSQTPDLLEMIQTVEKELPSLPFDFLYLQFAMPIKRNFTCAPYPSYFNIKYHNIYWQTYHSANVTFQLYGAYYDKRQFLQQKPVIRLLAMINQINVTFPINYCQIWFNFGVDAVVVPVHSYQPIWRWGKEPYHLYPHLLTCEVPEKYKFQIPKTISLVNEPCEHATNNLRVIYEPTRFNAAKEKFAVCVKNLVYPYTDISNRLVEWLELLRLLGVSKIFIYKLQIHANMTKVLDFYINEGLVEVISYTYAAGEPNLPGFQHMIMEMNFLNMVLNELIPLNDCFYRNLYKYEFVTAMDTDEVIMPLDQLKNWQHIIEINQQQNKNCFDKISSFCFLNTYYPASVTVEKEINGVSAQNIPNYLHMLQHVQRVEQHSWNNRSVKCLHNTETVITLHNHYALSHATNSCAAIITPTDVAQLQHYREPVEQQDLEHLIEDANIWRFKNILIERTTKVFRVLGFLVH